MDLVTVTDHDSIDAVESLRLNPDFSERGSHLLHAQRHGIAHGRLRYPGAPSYCWRAAASI
jgi:hypothetical protein